MARVKKTYRDVGIVLRTTDLGEADRIITLLTREHGKVRAVAKGVRKTKSKFGARLEPFSYTDIQFYTGKNLQVIAQAESIAQYHRAIVQHYDAYTAACAIAETCAELVSEEQPDFAHFTLCLGALHALAVRAHKPDLIVNSYILRALAYSGWQLAIDECAVCSAPGPHETLNIHAGGAVCERCRPPASSVLPMQTWQLLGSLAEGKWDVADAAALPARRSAGAVIAAYAQWQLEHSVNSLRFMDHRLIE